MRSTEDSEPFDFYAELRTQGQVVWDQGLHAWLVNSYAACKEMLLNDEKLFDKVATDPKKREAEVLIAGGRRHMKFLVGAEHHRMHHWWLRAFSPRRLDHWRDTMILPIANRLVDGFASGSAELVDEFAEKLPVRVIGAVMGLPYEDDGWIDHWKRVLDALQEYFDNTLQQTDQMTANAIAATNELDEMLMPFVRARRSGVGDDLIALLWRDGPGLLDGWNEEDVRANVRNMFLGGSDTSTHAIANAFYLLASRPVLQDRLRAAGDEAVGRFVEESLRLYGAIHFRSREAVEDTTIAGCPIHKGDRLASVQASANRDPEHYADPDEIQLDRKAPRDHIAFNFGPRTCVGAALARAEIHHATAVVLDRLRELRLDPDAEPPRFTGFLLRDYRPLNILFTPA